jgi:hypothetical protein
MQPGECQVRFGLDPTRRQHHHRRRLLFRIIQQRRLADPRLAAHDQRPGRACPGVLQQGVDGRTLTVSSQEPHSLLETRPCHSAHGNASRR